jgi:hypothetical protein
LPGGASLARAYFVGQAQRHPAKQRLSKHNTHSRNDEKTFSASPCCAVACLVFVKKGDDYNEAWIKDTNGFDILMGQFAHNIENIWGFNEVLIAGLRTTLSTPTPIRPVATSTLMRDDHD